MSNLHTEMCAEWCRRGSTPLFSILMVKFVAECGYHNPTGKERRHDDPTEVVAAAPTAPPAPDPVGELLAPQTDHPEE